VDEGVLGRAEDDGVLVRAGVAAGVLGAAVARGFAAERVAVPVDVVDCPVCWGFRGVEVIEIAPPDVCGLSGADVEDLAGTLGVGDLTDAGVRAAVVFA